MVERSPESDTNDRHDRWVTHVRDLFARSIDLKHQVSERYAGTIVQIAEVVADAILRGRKVLLCGNGGSAADAQHLAAELLIRLRPHIDRAPLPALALAADTSSLTACANDYSFEVYYERMTQALGAPGDILIAITTSGRSPNVVRALQAARQKQMVTVGLLGGGAEPALSHCDWAVVVPSTETGRVQEAHIAIGHALMELVEDMCRAGSAR